MVGIAAIGANLSQILSGALAFNDISINQARSLDPLVFDHYLEGLYEAGWQGDPKAVRLGYAVFSVLHNLFRMLRVQRGLRDEANRRLIQSKGGYPIDQHIDQWIEMFPFFDDLAEEAHRLVKEDL